MRAPQTNFIRKATACQHSFVPICADSKAAGMVIAMDIPSSQPEKIRSALSDSADTYKIENIHIHNWNSGLFQFLEFSAPLSFIIERCSISSNSFTFYQVLPGKIQKSEFELSGFPNYDHRSLHRHNCFELMFLFSGTMRHRIENRTFTYHPGQCCIINRNIKHVEDFSGDFQAVFLQLMPDFAAQICSNDVYYEDGACKLRDSAIYQFIRKNQSQQENYEKTYLDILPVVPEDKAISLAAPMFQQLLDEIMQQKPGYFFMAESLLARFFAVLEDASLFSLSEIHVDASSHEYLLTKLALLMESKHGRITRTELEKHMNYSSDYLNRIVKKYTAMNLTEYGQTFYLEDARRMLLKTDKTISEIIHELGFSNRGHFYRIFTEKYGATPQEYRQANGQ